MTTFRGLDLLTIRPALVDGGARREALAVSDAGIAGVHGAQVPDVPDTPAGATLPLSWVCTTRAELAALEAFLIARRGRAVPFWCPTYRQDAIVTANSGSAWTVAGTSYVGAFARLAAERGGADYWVGLHVNGTTTPSRVTSATDNGDGTSTLTGSPMAGGTTAGGVLFARLEVVRLASDEWTVTYRSGRIATIALDVITVPRETP